MSMQRLLTNLARYERHPACKLPRLIVLTDCQRGFSLAQQQKLWPDSALFIERTFGRAPSKKLPSRRGLQLATTTPRLARAAALDGVHWPQQRLSARHHSACAGLIETASAHNGLEIAKAVRAGVQLILISTAFPSHSPSAKRALGPHRLAILARRFPQCTLFALGGIDASNSKLLRTTGIYGIGLVSFDGSKTKRKLKS
jgi:thiamine-phosphate pyrophosphorylase